MLEYRYSLFIQNRGTEIRSLDKQHSNSAIYLLTLLAVSIVSHFPFVLKGFGEIDATKIAVSTIDIINNGKDAALANLYFSDVIPLYVLYLKGAMKLLDNNYSYLPMIMNYTNAVIGTLIIIPAFISIRNIFGNEDVAFCSVLALIFAPSFYQSTITGFPHLIAFFFLLVSLCFYISGLDHEKKSTAYLLMTLSSVFMTIAFLFKSDYLLASGIFMGMLFIRKTKDKGKIAGAFLIILAAGALFLILRDMILGPGPGTTMSKQGLSEWYEYSLIIPNSLTYLIRQVRPIAYGAGIVTFVMGAVSFAYFLFKRKTDVMAFMVSWPLFPIIFWIVLIGNNARHNMFTTLPILAVIMLFFHRQFPKYAKALTLALILGNFFITPPSYSIITPSGSLFKSNEMLEGRMEKFNTATKEIVSVDEDKIAVLGYFHNPHVMFDIMCSLPSYKAEKIGRENYRITAGGKEFVFIYFVILSQDGLMDELNLTLEKYPLENHVFVSAMYDLSELERHGLRTTEISLIKRKGL